MIPTSSHQFICSQRTRISYQLKVCKDRRENIHARQEIIHTGSEILIPDPKLSGSPNYSKNVIRMRLFCCQITFINLCVTDPAVERIRVTN